MFVIYCPLPSPRHAGVKFWMTDSMHLEVDFTLLWVTWLVSGFFSGFWISKIIILDIQKTISDIWKSILDIHNAALFLRDIPKTFLYIRNNYFRYRQTFFLISKILVFSGYLKILFRISEKLFWISRIKYPFSSILDIQNTYFWYPKLLFLISRISVYFGFHK